MNHSILYKFSILGLAFSLSLTASPAANAGFEWAPAASGPAVTPAPLPPVMREEYKETSMPAASQPIIKEVPVYPERNFEIAQGFGSDLPLVTVLNQVVPKGYSYSFDAGVNPATLLSWQGGKPWNQVLGEALAPAGLHLVVSDNTAWVRQGHSDMMASTGSATLHTSQEGAKGIKTIDMMAAADAMIKPAPMGIAGSEIEVEEIPVSKPAMNEPVVLDAASQPQQPTMPSAGQRAKADLMLRLATMTPAEKATYYKAVSQRSETINPDNLRRTAPKEGDNVFFRALRSDPKSSEKGSFVYEADNTPAALQAQTNQKASMAPVSLTPQPAPAMDDVAVMEPIDLTSFQTDEMIAAPSTEPVVDADYIMDPFEILYWEAAGGTNLNETLERWANDANVKLLWETPADYSVPQNVRLHGTFPDAITALLGSFGNADNRPMGRLHPNLPDGPSVLIIQSSVATN